MQNKMVSIEKMGSMEFSGLRPGFDTAMFIETSQILQHHMFQNSPTMTKLLIWLLHETLAGRGDTVKSYTIAVEALGRPESFDSQADSYPRVQTSRLRRALETYYSQHGPVREQCVYLKPGSYRLRFAKLDLAYPQLYRPLSRQPSPADKTEHFQPTSEQAANASFKKTGMTELPTSLLVFILVSLVAMLGFAVIGD